MKRYKVNSAIQLFLVKEDEQQTKLLLQKRTGGWASGMWDSSASGHVDENEPMTYSLQREAKEEIGVDIANKDVSFVNMQHSNLEGEIYYNGYFFAKTWKGEPRVCEKDLCTELQWFDIEELPENIIPNRLQAISDYKNGVTFTEFGWDKEKD